ncbi:conserved Plasmodium protein, unknown function [Plasmodium malariae]|uniref:Uncharacterized protein n=1 Tax=Plasmodium malariae TaxID=5858 RepID=A0A1D3SQI7_PLAMA|nr:conserved Plasmodium protein, unknown function [Plasmodium malariae]SCO94157.1 conserved Plasmodium protein, unknown function [Plasmodium malariae]
MDALENEMLLFSPNITEINYGIFDLWNRGYNEYEVLYLLQNSLYSNLIRIKNEKYRSYVEQYLKDIRNKEKNGDTNIEDEKETIRRKLSKDNVFFEKHNLMNMSNIDNRGNGYLGGNVLFHRFLCMYVQQQFYVFNILAYHLTNLDLRFSNFHVPINKNKAQKLIRIYFNIDFNLEKEIIKCKSINNVAKYTNELVKITNINKSSVRKQLENIKNVWKYILSTYEDRNVNMRTMHKKRKISIKRIVKFIKTYFQLYKFFIKKGESVKINTNDDPNRNNRSFLFNNKKKKRKGKGKKKGKSNTNSKNEYVQHNIIKILENMLGIYLAKRYFRLYWIMVYHIEVPKKINIAYPYFNNIILLLLEKLQINDFMLPKEYINISKNIYSTYKSNKKMDRLKSKLYSLADIDSSLRSSALIRLKCILNLLCCFRNSYELTKLLLIFYELQKYEPFINEKTFIKQNIGNNDFVNRIMGFIKDAENFSKRKKAEYENQLGIEEPNNF